MTGDELRKICIEHAIPVSLAGFVRESDAARLLDVDVRTLQNWRRYSRGPECVRMGSAWRYHIQALAVFMTPTAELRRRRTDEDVSVRDGREGSLDDTNLTDAKDGS